MRLTMKKKDLVKKLKTKMCRHDRYHAIGYIYDEYKKGHLRKRWYVRCNKCGREWLR